MQKGKSRFITSDKFIDNSLDDNLSEKDDELDLIKNNNNKENVDLNSNSIIIKEKDAESCKKDMSIDEDKEEDADTREQNENLVEKIRIKSIDIMFNILTLTPSKLF